MHLLTRAFAYMAVKSVVLVKPKEPSAGRNVLSGHLEAEEGRLTLVTAHCPFHH